MKQQVRELLVITKVAQNWQYDFEQKVDELMSIVSKVDNEKKVQDACEILDVYHHKSPKARKTEPKKKTSRKDKPFEFLVFRN